MNLRTTLIAATLSLASLSAFAQSTPRVDARQDNQAARIEQGKATGELTPREAARMQRGQNHVQRMENRAMADGKVTGAERARIEGAQDVQSARVHRQKHDGQHDRNHNGRVDRRP